VADVGTGGGASIDGVVDTSGGGFVGRDRPENNTTVNVSNEAINNYSMADLRLDLRFLRQEVDRLKEDLIDARFDGKDVNGRVSGIEKDVNFLEEQVKNMLLLKPVPSTTPVVPMWALNVLTAVIGIFILAAVLLLIFLARGHV